MIDGPAPPMRDGPALPVALRPLGSFPPRCQSIFEDPGDERSWHVSQLFASLMRFYEGREPGWYSGVVAPLIGCRSVLELGCGPGLALRALRARGVDQVLGIDRWPEFAAIGHEHGIPVLMHDLTLPMPFIQSESVEGVFSHYVLDYMSPIGVRQALREASRVLRPGGRLLVLLAAIGLAGGDEARTISYAPEVMHQLLVDAGFDGPNDVEAPTGRNTVVRATAASPVHRHAAGSIEIVGEAQLSAGFGSSASTITVDVIGGGWDETHTLSFEQGLPRLPGINPLAISVRVVHAAASSWELQVCAWNAGQLSHACALRRHTRPSAIELRCASPAEHLEVWQPKPLQLGRAGGARELKVVTELRDQDRVLEALVLADARGGAAPGLDRLDATWLAGAIHGVLLGPDAIAGRCPALFWALSRSAVVGVLAESWREGVGAASAAPGHDAPILVLAPERPADPDDFRRAVELAAQSDHIYVLSSTGTRELGSLGDAELVAVAAVPEGPAGRGGEMAIENMRYLHERALLLRLRAASGRTAAEVGRLPPLDSGV